MVIKPNNGARVFAGTAGAVLLFTACLGLLIPFPGLIFTCLGLPLAALAFAYAFGVAQTRVDSEGIHQRNFFFVIKKLAWPGIESGKVVSQEYEHTDEDTGWIESRTRTFMEFSGGDVKIHVLANSSGHQDWWDELRRIAKEKLGEKFAG
jgi:hypothetical protein